MITNRKYYMQKALILLVFVLLSFNTNATEITNNEFAKRINKCVGSIYADKEQYPKHKQIPVELIIAQAAHESAYKDCQSSLTLSLGLLSIIRPSFYMIIWLKYRFNSGKCKLRVVVVI